MDSGADKVKMYFTQQELGDNYRIYEQMKSAIAKSGIQARMPFEIRVQ